MTPKTTLKSLISSTKTCLQRPASQAAIRWLLASTLILATFTAGLFLYGRWYDTWTGYGQSSFSANEYCNVAVIRVYGDITGYAEDTEYLSSSADDVVARIREAEAAPNILGMLLVVGSAGGYPAASQSISTAINKSPLWSMAYVRDQALSGGYLIASAADTITASPFADIGSIGITMSYLDQTRMNEKEGYTYVNLSSGAYKDAGSPDKELTAAERALFERDIEAAHEAFVDLVAANREMSREEVATLADGSSMNAKLALEKGLIDQIATDDVWQENWFAEMFQLPAEEVVLCE